MGGDSIKMAEGEIQEIKKSEDRLLVLKKIEELESNGIFDVDVEEDPPTIPIHPGEVDFLRKKISSKIKAKYANKLALKFFNNLFNLFFI